MTLSYLRLTSAVLLLVVPAAAPAAIFGGVDFPQGAISFADEVVSYDPAFGGGNVPGLAYQTPDSALGVPDYPDAADSYVSLGAGGRIVLKFTDNLLTGSGSDLDDLWIFEIGPDVEDTVVDISVDGITWSNVGLVTGSTRGIDIDFFGFGTGHAFSYVRLTDVLNEGDTGGMTVGADIDAVGAISTRPALPVPEPASWALMIGGLGLAGAMLRRRGRMVPA